MLSRGGKLSEDALHLVGCRALRLGEPALEQRQIRLVARFQIRRDQVVFATEMVIERPLGQPRLFGNGVDADGADSLGVEELAGCFDDALACRDISSGYT